MKRGLVHIYTGDGKGKTTAAMGLVVRAAGYEMNICILQFLKGRQTGEKTVLEKIPGVTYRRANTSTKFTIQMSDEEETNLKEEIKTSWLKLKETVKKGEYDLIILDEIMAVINNGFLPLQEVIELIDKKQEELELVMTGRNAPEELMQLADYVTEMKLVKHPYTRNIPARRGIEF